MRPEPDGNEIHSVQDGVAVAHGAAAAGPLTPAIITGSTAHNHAKCIAFRPQDKPNEEALHHIPHLGIATSEMQKI